MGTNQIYSQQSHSQPPDYGELVELFNDWRDFENPPRLNGAPDYTADRFKKDHTAFKDLQNRLTQITIDELILKIITK